MGLWYAYIIKKGVTENVELLPRNDWVLCCMIPYILMSQRKKGKKKIFLQGIMVNIFSFFPLWHWNAWIWLKWSGAGSSILKLSGFVYLVGRWRWKVTRVWSFVYQIYEWLECARDWLQWANQQSHSPQELERQTISKPVSCAGGRCYEEK